MGLDTVVSYYRRRKEEESRSYSSDPCPGRGLLGPEFACGAPAEVLASSYETYHRMLLVDLSKLTKEARDRIMGDYDVGVQHCKYVVLMKFAVWGQLPLVLVGIAHFDAAKAKEAAIRSLEQWHATADFEGHHEVVLELFRPGSDLRAAIESVARGTPVQSLPLLQPFIRQWSMMRVNELSVERLHKIGSLVATSAPTTVVHWWPLL